MKNLSILIIASIFTINANAFSLNIGQRVQIEDASQVNSSTTFQNGTYYTVTSAKMLKFGVVEVGLEFVITPQDLNEGEQSGLIRSIDAKIYVNEGDSLSDVRGLRVIN